MAKEAGQVTPFRDTELKICELCGWLKNHDVGYIEPHGNFIMIDVKRDAASFGKEMRLRGIAVGRPFPPLNNYLRVTVGTADNMRRFTKEFESVYRGWGVDRAASSRFGAADV